MFFRFAEQINACALRDWAMSPYSRNGVAHGTRFDAAAALLGGGATTATLCAEVLAGRGAMGALAAYPDANLPVGAVAGPIDALRRAAAVHGDAQLAPPDFWRDSVNTAFRYRPPDLLNYLETFWSLPPGTGRNYGIGLQEEEDLRQGLGEVVAVNPNVANVRQPVRRPSGEATFLAGHPDLPSIPTAVDPPPVWKHLIYAYAVENTRIVEIFRRVLREMLTGERLGRPNPTVLSWLRTTEDLFFSDRAGSSIFSPTSRLRDDAGAIRRNVYYRLLGIDLNHGTEDGRPYSYAKADVANREFARTFEQLLREVWRAYTNRNNQVGPNTTDDNSIVDLVLRLHDMLRDRRKYGNLAREEFSAVATLSWFHLTVSADNELVTMLKAEGTNAAERLRVIGERVGLPAHARSYNYFQMANELSYLLSQIETGLIDERNVAQLYDPAAGPTMVPRVLTIINNWSAATGRSLKEFVGVPTEPSATAAARRTLVVV